MPLVKNQIIPLTIDALSSDGNGVGRFEGQAVFVPFAAVGDVLSVKVVKICKSYAFGIVESVLTPGTGRIPADCPIFGRCGGCCFRHLSYEAELAAKQGFVADALRRIGGMCPCGTSFPLHRPSATGTRCSILCFSLGTAVFKPAFMRAAAIGRCLAGTVCSSPDC